MKFLRIMALLGGAVSAILCIAALALLSLSFLGPVHFHVYSREHPWPASRNTPDDTAPYDMGWLKEPGATPYQDYLDPEYEAGVFSGTVYFRRNKYVRGDDPEYGAWESTVLSSEKPHWFAWCGFVYGRCWHQGDTSRVWAAPLWVLVIVFALPPMWIFGSRLRTKARQRVGGFPIQPIHSL